MREAGHLYIFTYQNSYGVIMKTGIRDLNRKDAVEHFFKTHSAGCQIINIKTEYNYR